MMLGLNTLKPLPREDLEYIDCEHKEGFIAELRVGGIGHPNSKYHGLIADCVANYIEQAD